MLIGFLGVGKLIRYIPYPVVSGYLSGVGLIIVGSQIPKFAGAPAGSGWFAVLVSPQLWDWRALAIGGATVLAMLQLAGNHLVVGPLGASAEGYLGLLTNRWFQIGDLRLSQVAALLGSALTLAALLSMGASMVNLSSGATTRMSGILEGAFALIAALMLGAFVAWIPVATLSGILIVVGFRMIDTDPLRYLESRSTVLDFLVVLVVVAVALSVGLIAASATGVGLAIILFLREPVGGNVIRGKSLVSQRSSTWYRPEAEVRLLEQKGASGIIFELQGSLFFGTTHDFYLTLEPELHTRDFIILDLQRVQSVDLTAAHTLILIRDMLAERNAVLLLSNVRESLPNGRNLRKFLELSGLTGKDSPVLIMPTLESAIEWVEERLLGVIDQGQPDPAPLELHEMELFQGRKDDTMADLEAAMERRSWKAGEAIYRRGDPGDALYLIRRGEVRLLAPTPN
jgi:SulP family sulfate permease